MANADPATGSGNAAQIAYWNDRAAVAWTAFQERIDAAFTRLTAASLDAAAPATGERVINVGCGCGATVLELARRVGPSGHVLGLDVSEPMAGRARERIAAAKLAQAEVVISDAATYPLRQANADLLFSRFGVDQLRGVLHELGATPATLITVLSDGADGPRSLGESASVGPTHHVLDWFHLSYPACCPGGQELAQHFGGGVRSRQPPFRNDRADPLAALAWTGRSRPRTHRRNHRDARTDG
jgi:SAM-dependent methyltransferase